MTAIFLKRITLLALCVSLSACGGGSSGSGDGPSTSLTPGSGPKPGASGGASPDAGDDAVPSEERTDVYAITAVGIYIDAEFLIGDAVFTLADTASSFRSLSATTVYPCFADNGETVFNTSKTASRPEDERQVFPGDFIQVLFNDCSIENHIRNGEQRLDFIDYPPVPADGEPFAFGAVYRSFITITGGSGSVNGQIDRLVYHTESRLKSNGIDYLLSGVNSHLFPQSIAPEFFPDGAAFATPQLQINEDARWIDPEDTVPVLASEIGYTNIDGLESDGFSIPYRHEEDESLEYLGRGEYIQYQNNLAACDR